MSVREYSTFGGIWSYTFLGISKSLSNSFRFWLKVLSEIFFKYLCSSLNLTAVKSANVDAPVVTEFPLTLECKVVECQNTVYGFRVLGEIVNVLVITQCTAKASVDMAGAFIYVYSSSGC
jgi:hypothetical protein